MEYHPAADSVATADPWAATSDFLGFLPASFHFQEEPEEFDMENLLRDYAVGSPYSAGDTGGSSNASLPELLPHPAGAGDIGGSSSINAGIVTLLNFAQPALDPNDGCNASLPPPAPVLYPAGGCLTTAHPPFCPVQCGVDDGQVEELQDDSLDNANSTGARPAGTGTENPDHQVLTVSAILSMLREVCDRWPRLSEQEKREYPVVVDLLATTDPWDSVVEHPEGFVTKASNTKTRGGYWKERPHFTAIRGGRPGEDDDDDAEQQQHPHYVGARKTYQFHRWNGSRTKWLMHEYHLLDPHSDLPGLVLDEDGLVFRVFFTNEHEGGVSEEYQPPPKRRRSSAPNGESEVWKHFTKIYSKAGKLAYAACHDCDRIFGAQPKNGTSSLIRHNENHLQPRSR